MARPANRPPLWVFPSSQTNLVAVEQSTLTFTNEVTELDPGQTVRFELLSDLPGAGLVATNGVFSWTPAETQGPSTNELLLVAIDSGTPPERSTNRIVVIVLETNATPAFEPVTIPEAAEGRPWTFRVLANDRHDVPPNDLTYSLPSGPPGATIDSTTGQLTWIPGEMHGPGTTIFAVTVFDNGEPARSATTNFPVRVNEVNQPPIIDLLADAHVDEATVFALTLKASDPDWPTNKLTWRKVSGPAALAVDPTTGGIAWVPGEAEGPNTYLVVVAVDDDGESSLSHTNQFQVTVHEVNQPPTLAPLAAQTVELGETLQVTPVGSDADLPAQVLTFSLEGAPRGATIHPTTGVITWRPNGNTSAPTPSRSLSPTTPLNRSPARTT